MNTLDLMSYRHCRMQWKLSTELGPGFPRSLFSEALTRWTRSLARACVALGDEREAAIRTYGDGIGDLAPFFPMPEVAMYSALGSRFLRRLAGGKDPELWRRGYVHNPGMISKMDVLVGDDIVEHSFATVACNSEPTSCFVLHPSSPFVRTSVDAPLFDGPFYWLNLMLVSQMNIMTAQQTGITWKLLTIDVNSFREGGMCNISKRSPGTKSINTADRYLQEVIGGLKAGIYYPGTKSRGICFGCPAKGTCWEEGLDYS